MRTFIFILALSAVALPALAVTTTNPINCGGAGTAKFCNKCLATDDAQPAATDQCFDCIAGYYLTFTGTGDNGVCTRCGAGTGIAAGNGSTRPAQTQSSASCTACHETCARCFAPNSAASCSKCALDRFTEANAVNGVAACSGTCTAGKTRLPGTDADFTATQAAETVSVCTENCNTVCATCRGTAATACTKCAAGHYIFARTGANTFGTCAACDDGKGKDPDANPFTSSTTAPADKNSVCKACTPASNCGVCSEANLAQCITCPSGKTLQADKTCNAPTNGGTNGGSTNGGTNGGTTGGSTTNTTGTTNTTNTTQSVSASVVQVVCGAFLAAYALF